MNNIERLPIFSILKTPLDFVTLEKGIDVNAISVQFKEIAKLLFEKYYIVVCDCNDIEHLYKFAEVEFYYCKRGGLDDEIFRCTYPRTSEAGKFLWHYSGVDICFESNSDIKDYYFGGILIRSLIDENDEVIGGPGRCANELSFLCKRGKTPDLVLRPKEKEEEILVLEDVRQGIDCDVDENGNEKVKLCFFRDLPVEKWKKRTNTVLRMTKDGYKRMKTTYYYNDHPTPNRDRIKKVMEKRNKKAMQK